MSRSYFLSSQKHLCHKLEHMEEAGVYGKNEQKLEKLTFLYENEKIGA